MLARVDAGAVLRVAGLFETGAALVVASADAQGRPSITRGWAATVSEDGYVAVCITAPNGSTTRANIAANGRLAVTVVDPTTYGSAQVKGVVDCVREPNDPELDRVEAHARRFSDATATVGIVNADCLMLGDLLAVGFVATEVYDQTPGGAAGKAMV
jgi:flavin reductase (DIM6/NTAB) family NADH-FMN oxidoreductase RutF